MFIAGTGSSAPSSSSGAEVVGRGMVAWGRGVGMGWVPLISSGLCFCFCVSSALGRGPWYAGAQDPTCPLPCSQGHSTPWRCQLES